MFAKELALLEDVGLTIYERRALAALIASGIADAATLCRDGEIELRRVTGVRYSGELGHPFHVVDEETVVLPLDHPFVREGRYASLLVRDRQLAHGIAGGFRELWRKAMHDLREINCDPRVSSRTRSD